VRDAVRDCADLWRELAAGEEAAGLPVTRPLDPGFADVVWRWARGDDLDDVLAGVEVGAGDFVRDTKQVADLLRQLREVSAGRALAGTAHNAARTIVRGVVAYTGI
ncbi:MAG TPA: hypothetical protein VG452_13625, partial [Egibacteraceae bacterium]|nr:hypothetical protein [Egibacteraceae bacterium]